MEQNLFTINKEDLPSKMYEIVLQEPTFEDRKTAIKRMPSNPNSNPGYDVTHLLLSMSIHSVNGQLVQDDPKDPIYKIRYLPPEDTQYLISVFIEAFTLNEELSDTAKRISELHQSKPGYTVRLDKSDMPTESFGVSFRVPTTGMQMEVEREYPGAGCGYSSEEMLFCYCLTHIDDKPIENKPKDYISIIYDWPHVDAQFAMGVFLNLCFLNQEGQNSAKSLGKTLRRNAKKDESLKSTPGDTTIRRGKTTPSAAPEQ